MKISKYILAAFSSLVMLASCEKEYVVPNEFADVTWLTDTDGISDSIAGAISVGDFISYADLSRGNTSHTWTIDEGAYYLDGDQKFTKEDQAAGILDQFILEGAGKVSTDKTVHILFTEGGISNVRLYNEFDQYVSYKALESELKAKQVGDKWIIDTTFAIDVYDTLKAEFMIAREDGEVLLHSDDIYGNDAIDVNDTLTYVVDTLEAGEKLVFTDLSTQGRPTGIKWNYTGIKDVTPAANGDSIQVFQFPKLGHGWGSVTVSRSANKIPAGSHYMRVPLTIWVKPSSLPFEVLGMKQLGNEMIQLELSGEAVAAADMPDFFTVHATNSAKGFDQDIAVNSVEVVGSDATLVNLVLAEPIYNTDVVTVTLASDNPILSTDTRPLIGVTDMVVQMSNQNLMSNPVFSMENVGGNTMGTGWKGSWDTGAGTSHGYVEDPDPAKEHGMVMMLDGNNERLFMESIAEFPLVKGKTYEFSFWVWASEDFTSGSFGPAFISRAKWAWYQNWTGTPAERGKWVRNTRTFTSNHSNEDYYISVRIPNGGTSDGVIYFDDFQLVEREVRP